MNGANPAPLGAFIVEHEGLYASAVLETVDGERDNVAASQKFRCAHGPSCAVYCLFVAVRRRILTALPISMVMKSSPNST
jgi:hypothetical protein